MKNIIKYFFLSLLVLIIASCPKVFEQTLVLYYSDPQGMYLIPVSTTVKLEGINLDKITKPEHIKPVLDELRISRKDKGLRNCIPDEIKFQNIEYDQEKKLVTLTLNSEKNRLGDTEEILMTGAIVNTLTELKDVSLVKINIGNLNSDFDYSEPIKKEIWINSWFNSDEIDKKETLALVYWLSKDRKYYVPITVPIPKNDVETLLNVLKDGPQVSRKEFLEPSINKSLDIIIKAVNLNHIDIELKSNKEGLERSAFEDAKKAVLLTISELNIFDTIKFIIPNDEEIINLKDTNPKKSINRIEFFAGSSKV